MKIRQWVGNNHGKRSEPGCCLYGDPDMYLRCRRGNGRLLSAMGEEMKKALLFLLLLLSGCAPSTDRKPRPAPDVQPCCKPVLIIFSATWCAPCRALHETTLRDRAVLEAFNGYEVHHIDVGHDHAQAQKYDVTAIPTYLVVRDGVTVKRGEGYRTPKDFLVWLNK